MKFKRDKSGKLEKYVKNCIKHHRPELECLEFLCAWREEKWQDGMLVMAEIQKLSPKYRDTLGYDVILTVDMNAWKECSKEEKKKLIFHELSHIRLEYDGEKQEDKENWSAKEIFESMLEETVPSGDPKEDKAGRIIVKCVPHSLQIMRFKEELLLFGLSPSEEAIRQFLNYVHKKVGLCQEKEE